jgi:hypothetical protein
MDHKDIVRQGKIDQINNIPTTGAPELLKASLNKLKALADISSDDTEIVALCNEKIKEVEKAL